MMSSPIFCQKIVRLRLFTIVSLRVGYSIWWVCWSSRILVLGLHLRSRAIRNHSRRSPIRYLLYVLVIISWLSWVLTIPILLWRIVGISTNLLRSVLASRISVPWVWVHPLIWVVLSSTGCILLSFCPWICTIVPLSKLLSRLVCRQRIFELIWAIWPEAETASSWLSRLWCNNSNYAYQ